MTEIEFLSTLQLLLQTNTISDPKFPTYLSEKLQNLSNPQKNKSQALTKNINTEFSEYKIHKKLSKKKIRGLVEGVFDMTHFGHFNMLRQASLICDEVIVAINSDRSVKKAKGPTVLKEKERKKIVENCKWVKEVHIIDSYFVDLDILDDLKCDFVIHGDDLVQNEDGECIYDKFDKVGKFRVCKRTTGISTTDIVTKLLSVNIPLFKKNLILQKKNKFYHSMKNFKSFKQEHSVKEGKIVYISGSFDLLTPEYVDVLKKSKGNGDYLIVGLFSDDMIREKKGELFPILDINGRALNLFSLNFVDDIIFEAPFQINKKFIQTNKIDLICEGNFGYLDLKVDKFEKIEGMGFEVLEIKKDVLFPFSKYIGRLKENEEYYKTSVLKKIEKLKSFYKNEDLTK